MENKNNDKIREELTNEELDAVTGGAASGANYIAGEQVTPGSYIASKPIYIPIDGKHIDDDGKNRVL